MECNSDSSDTDPVAGVIQSRSTRTGPAITGVDTDGILNKDASTCGSDAMDMILISYWCS